MLILVTNDLVISVPVAQADALRVFLKSREYLHFVDQAKGNADVVVVPFSFRGGKPVDLRES